MEVSNNTTTMHNTTLHHHHHHHPSFSLPSDDHLHDRRYLLAELTRQLARNSLHHDSNSPPLQKKDYSTFSGFTSPDGPSRTPSPERDVAWELFYGAASEVAKLKMEAMAAQLNLIHLNRALNASPSPNQCPQLKSRGYCPHHHSAWPSVRRLGESEMRSGYLGSGSGRTPIPPVKRRSTGTGVFIPLSQRVGSLPEPPRKKPTGRSSVFLPARVVHALNLDINNGVHRNSQTQFPSGFLTENVLREETGSMKKVEGGATMAGGGHEICLPTEWTY